MKRIGMSTSCIGRLSRKMKVLLGVVFVLIVLCCAYGCTKKHDNAISEKYFEDNDLFFEYRHPINDIQGKYCYYKAYCKDASEADCSKNDNIFKIEKYLDGVFKETTLIEQDKDGYEKRTLLNRNGAITEDENGVAIYRLKPQDGSSSVWDVFCYNRYDKLIDDNTSVAQYKYSNTDSTQIIEYFDRNGRQISNKYQVYKTCIHYNKQLYIDSIKYADRKNFLTKSTEDGLAKKVYEYNEKNERIKQFNYDKYNQLTWDDKYVTIYEYEYDDAGNLIRQWNEDFDGRLKTDRYDIACIEYSYNADGSQEKIQYYTLNQTPSSTEVEDAVVLTKNGIAEYNYEYKNGNTVAAFYRNNLLNATTDEYGIARYSFECDKKGNRTKQMNYGIDNRPTENIYGIATIKWEYDKYGNNTKRSFYGMDGKLIENPSGIAIFKRRYDSNGNVTEESYFGIDGKTVANIYGAATFRYKYDCNGNMTQKSFYNIEGKRFANKDGVAIYKWEYGINGNRTKESHYGSDGELINNGIATKRREYDKYGKKTKESYFNKDGKPLKDEYGVATYQWEYDGWNKVKESYYDEYGYLTTDTDGKAIVQWEYDDNDSITYKSYWGTDRQLVEDKNGIAEILYEYDEKGRKTEEKFYGVNGLKEDIYGFCMYKWKYEGDTCETFSQFGVIGITGTYLKEDSLGIAKTITRHDNKGRLTEKSYRNRNESLVADKLGVAKYIHEYADTWTWEAKTIHCFDIHNKEIKDISDFVKQTAALQAQKAPSGKDEEQNILLSDKMQESKRINYTVNTTNYNTNGNTNITQTNVNGADNSTKIIEQSNTSLTLALKIAVSISLISLGVSLYLIFKRQIRKIKIKNKNSKNKII